PTVLRVSDRGSAGLRQLSLVRPQAARNAPAPWLHASAQLPGVVAAGLLDVLQQSAVGIAARPHLFSLIPALLGELVRMLLQTTSNPAAAGPYVGAELPRVALARRTDLLHLLAEGIALLFAIGGKIGLVLRETLQDPPLPLLDTRAELLRVGFAGVIGRGAWNCKQRDRGDDEAAHEHLPFARRRFDPPSGEGHASWCASWRMVSRIDGSCGTEAISRLSARPMPGTNAPARRRG